MAEIEGIEVRFTGDVSSLVNAMAKVETALNKIQKESDETAKKTKTLGQRFADMRDFMQGPIAAGQMVINALQGIYRGIDNMIMAAAESDRAMANLSSVLRSTGYAAGITQSELVSLADELANVTLFEDEAVMQAEAVLLTFTQISGETFPRATKAAADMATVLGMDLQSAVTMLGKALQDPINGVGALRRVGVSLTEEHKKLVDQFMAVNDVASAQAVILKELEVEYGGAAKAVADTATGTWQQLKKDLGEVNEAFGKFLAELLATGKGGSSAIGNIAETLDAAAIDKKMKRLGSATALTTSELKVLTEYFEKIRDLSTNDYLKRIHKDEIERAKLLRDVLEARLALEKKQAEEAAASSAAAKKAAAEAVKAEEAKLKAAEAAAKAKQEEMKALEAADASLAKAAEDSLKRIEENGAALYAQYSMAKDSMNALKNPMRESDTQIKSIDSSIEKMNESLDGTILKMEQAFNPQVLNEAFDTFNQMGAVLSGNNDKVAALGAAFESLVTNIATGFTDMGSVADLVMDLIKLAFEGNDKRAQRFYDTLGKIAEKIMVALAPALELIMDILDAIAPLLDAIAPIIEGLMAILKPIIDAAAWLVNVLSKIISFLTDIVKKVLEFFGLLDKGGREVSSDEGKKMIAESAKAIGDMFKPPFLATGVQDFSGGAAIVGEQGPELVTLPRGANVYPTDQTAAMLGGRSVVVNITSPKALDPMSAQTVLRQTMRRMAAEGAL